MRHLFIIATLAIASAAMAQVPPTPPTLPADTTHHPSGHHGARAHILPPDSVQLVRTSGDTIIVNTTPLAQDVQGFRNVTPVEIYFVGGKVARVELQPCWEGGRFIAAIRQEGLFEAWNGKTPAEALATQVDAVTGATYSSNAIIENVRRGLQHYETANLSSLLPAEASPKTSTQVLLVLGVVLIVLGIVLGIRRRRNK